MYGRIDSLAEPEVHLRNIPFPQQLFDLAEIPFAVDYSNIAKVRSQNRSTDILTGALSLPRTLLLSPLHLLFLRRSCPSFIRFFLSSSLFHRCISMSLGIYTYLWKETQIDMLSCMFVYV